MNKSTKQLLLIIAFTITAMSSVYAQLPKVYLPLLETINLKKYFQYSSSKLLKNYIEGANRYQVIIQDNADSTVFSSDQVSLIQNKARLNNTAYFITGSLNRLGESVIVNINLFETETGKKIWFDQLKALTPDDLDPILQRFGANIGTENKAATNEDIYSVTDNETQTLNKKESTNNYGVGLNGAVLTGSQSGAGLPGLSFTWSFDSRDYIFDIRPSYSFNDNASLFSLSLEMNKPIYKTSSTPFVGGGLAFASTNLHSTNNNTYYTPNTDYSSYSANGYGIMALIGGGYIVNRTSYVSLRISGNYLLSFYDVKGSNNSTINNVTTSTDKNYGLTSGFMFRLEILFGKR